MKSINFPSKPQLYLALVILALVIFYLSKCRKPPEPKTITTTKVLKDTVRLIEEDRKHITDSFTNLLKKHYQQDDFNNGQFINLVNQNTELAEINENLQKELTYPDTCMEVVNKLNSAHQNYVSQTNRTIDQAKKSLINLSQTIQTQKSYLSAKDELYSRLKSANDTCIANNSALEKYAKKLKPKRSINLNVQAVSPYNLFKPVFGAGIGYENKAGLEVSFTYYTNNQISVGIRKPLVRF